MDYARKKKTICLRQLSLPVFNEIMRFHTWKQTFISGHKINLLK